MSLARNIKQFRIDQGISQEYMARKLTMHQTTYHRLEQNERGCSKRLADIASALDTTPETLRSYHVNQNEQGVLVPAEWMLIELEEQEQTIQQQQETIKFQNRYIAYVRTAWDKFTGQFSRPDYKPPAKVND